MYLRRIITPGLLIYFFALSLVHSSRDPGCLKCRKYNHRKINVHLVPHSHDDVGWLKTIDEYYYGLVNGIQDAGVQYIITSTVNALENNPERRYIQVETAYFWKWWTEQNDHMRQKFVNLVNNGQIEMVNGAWAMNDEACVNYQSTIDQFTWGLRLINQTIGTCGIPRVGWQIDPFGHSKEQANIFAQLGFDGVVFARLDHDDKENRRLTKSMDFAWQGNANLGNRTIFASILPTDLYQEPEGFCFDALCQDDPIVNDPDSPGRNVEEKVKAFAEIIKDYSKNATTNHVLIAMGGDFQYSNAEKNFISTDRLIKGFQNHSKIDVFYSTPSCYIKAINDFGPVLKLKTDDFFPYSDDPNNFWTGYFSSRPTNKRFERIGHNVLQVSKQLYAQHALRFGNKYEKHLTRLRETMGTLQHHDAITGTEKQAVSEDYIRLLSKAVEDAEEPLGHIISDLTGMGDIKLDMKSCYLSNISICNATQKSNRFVVFVYNPLSWNVTHYIRLPVETKSFLIRGPDGFELYDVTQPLSNFSFVDLPEKPAKFDLVFAARDVPPMGYKMYYIEKVANKNLNKSNRNRKSKKINRSYRFGNSISSFEIDPTTNRLKSITLNGKTLSITQNMGYYSSGNNSDNPSVASGAYIFRPDFTKSFETPTRMTKNTVENTYSFSGKLVDEFHQSWNGTIMKVQQVIRVYKNEGYIEFDWIVGNLNLTDFFIGVEAINKFTVTKPFTNNGIFYTDSNGREMMKRTLNVRSDYEYNSTVEPVASNYYPVTSKITIKDEKQNLRVTVLNDRSQGGSSLNEGEIELMLHRRLAKDDNKGVNEYLDETEFYKPLYVRGSHYLIIGKEKGANPNGYLTETQENEFAQQKLLQPWVGVSPVQNSFADLATFIKKPVSALNEGALPPHVNIMTFEPWTGNSYLLRLDYILSVNSSFERKVINLKKLFKDRDIKDVRETTLGANRWLDDYLKDTKYEWKLKGEAKAKISHRNDVSKWEIELLPMEIRTFVVTF